jgi:hypothetical protein
VAEVRAGVHVIDRSRNVKLVAHKRSTTKLAKAYEPLSGTS